MYARSFYLICGALLAVWTASPAFCQGVPPAITYQGKLTNTSGVPVPDGSRAMQFKLFDAQTSGTQLWDSGSVNVASTGGVFSVVLGVSPMPAITSATLTTDSIWLEVKVGTDPALPRVNLQSAPFALRSADLVMPFSRTITSTQAGFSVTNSGTGRAGRFEITNASNNSAALYAKTSGTGSSVWAESSTIATPLVAYNTGSPGNNACYVEINNSSNGNAALYSKTNGTGYAVQGVNTGTGRAGSFHITNASNSSPALYAATSGTGPAAVLDGKVGIGTANPQEKLHILSSDGSSSIIRLDGGATGGSGVGIRENGAARWTMLFRQWQSDNLVFRDEVGITDSLTLQSGTGRVGIGTSTPVTKLEVSDLMRVQGSTWPGSGEGLELGYDPSLNKGYVQAFDRTAGTWGKLYLGDGNVGIGAGATDPSAKLDVAGDLKVTGAVRGNLGLSGGAPFPRPAYDSGWLSMLPGSVATFTHSIGGDPNDYVVDLQRYSSVNQGWGINNFGVGGFYYDYDTHRYFAGAWWESLTSTAITVQVGSDGSGPGKDYVRVRIWVVK